MMIFGLAAAPGVGVVSHDDMATRRLSEIPWARLEVFTQTWQNCVNDAGANSSRGRSDDFTHHWSAPSGHDHANPGHHSGYDGYGHGGDYGGFGHAGYF